MDSDSGVNNCFESNLYINKFIVWLNLFESELIDTAWVSSEQFWITWLIKLSDGLLYINEI